MIWLSVASIILSLIAIGINLEMRYREYKIRKRTKELEKEHWEKEFNKALNSR